MFIFHKFSSVLLHLFGLLIIFDFMTKQRSLSTDVIIMRTVLPELVRRVRERRPEAEIMGELGEHIPYSCQKARGLSIMSGVCLDVIILPCNRDSLCVLKPSKLHPNFASWA